MRNAFAAAVFLIALNVSAGTISTIDHSSIPVGSGEYFMTVRGSGLGSQFKYDGPAGTFVLDANYDDGVGGTVIGWIPVEIVNDPGVYTLTVLGGGLKTDSGPVSFTVSKPGRQRFTLHLPELIAIPAKSRLGVGIKYDVTAIGGEGTPTIECDPVSGSTFPLGLSTIKCIATDMEGTRDTGEISVNVWDAAAPQLTVPKSFEVQAEKEEGAYVKFEASAYDDIDGELSVNCLPKSDSVFPPGRTKVLCEAWDAALNVGSGVFDVMVHPRDTGKLELRVPGDITTTASENDVAVVDFEVIAYGSADPDPVVECSPASGTTFNSGEFKVYCTATDDFEQRAEGGFMVIVKKYDGLKLSDVSAEATSENGADVSFKEVEGWTDALSCSHESGSSFAIGTTNVRCESRNAEGVLSAGTFDVTVADTIAPHIAAVRATPGETDAEQNLSVQIEVDAIDAADAMPRCSVSSIEGVSGRVTSDLAVSLRSDEATTRDFRLQISCVDRAGNRATEAVPIRLGGTGRRRATSN